jgi:hypothetical protein
MATPAQSRWTSADCSGGWVIDQLRDHGQEYGGHQGTSTEGFVLSGGRLNTDVTPDTDEVTCYPLRDQAGDLGHRTRNSFRYWGFDRRWGQLHRREQGRTCHKSGFWPSSAELWRDLRGRPPRELWAEGPEIAGMWLGLQTWPG